jgi:hypothetical protein
LGLRKPIRGRERSLIKVAAIGSEITHGTPFSQARSSDSQVHCAVSAALLPVCADAILPDPAAADELMTKRPTDSDDVVRDHRKTVGNLMSLDYAYRRECGNRSEAGQIGVKVAMAQYLP